jgi:hypothetical protein
MIRLPNVPTTTSFSDWAMAHPKEVNNNPPEMAAMFNRNSLREIDDFRVIDCSPYG